MHKFQLVFPPTHYINAYDSSLCLSFHCLFSWRSLQQEPKVFWKNIVPFWIHFIQMSNNSYKDLDKSTIKMIKVKCLSYLMKCLREKMQPIYTYICKIVYSFLLINFLSLSHDSYLSIYPSWYSFPRHCLCNTELKTLTVGMSLLLRLSTWKVWKSVLFILKLLFSFMLCIDFV